MDDSEPLVETEHGSYPSDHAHDECGVAGVWAPGEDVSRLIFLLMSMVQHRGQESAGIAVSQGEDIYAHVGMGLASQVFNEELLAELKGICGVGHVRYSTMGSTHLVNAQPVLVNTDNGAIALTHNGNIVNAVPIRERLQKAGVLLRATTDSELLAQLIATNLDQGVLPAITRMMEQAKGAYSLTILHKDKVIAVRDPHGFRPLCIGSLDKVGHVVASESCALSVVNAEFIREVEPGEIVVIDEEGLHSHRPLGEQPKAFCLFEFVYVARPDSHFFGRSVHMARRRMGHMLAREHPVPADIVIPIPETGIQAAVGYAEASRITYSEGLIKNRYIHRTFIQPDQRMRDIGVRMKFTPIKETLSGRRVVVVDDSIVRATSTRSLVRLIREGGAREVHLRISSPPFTHPCFYGIDTPRQEELVAHSMSVEQIRQMVGADTLGYLSMGGLLQAVDLRKGLFCRACFTGHYPTRIPPDEQARKLVLETADQRAASH